MRNRAVAQLVARHGAGGQAGGRAGGRAVVGAGSHAKSRDRWRRRRLQPMRRLDCP